MTAVHMDILHGAARRAESAAVFGSVEIEGGRLVCAAKASAEPAQYRLSPEGEALWVELVTADRWLSESIEADLMHTGDKLEELLDEELADLGHDGSEPTYEHFRSDDMLFTFRTRIPELDEETVARFLLAYEQCFRNLGDMDDDGGDD